MPDIKYPPVVIVDENDNEIGTAMLAEAWQQGLYHRVVAIFVTDDKGRMLLQLRSPNVKVYPNHWDQAAGGHVDEGQSYEVAAANELTEELGLHNVTLTEMGTYRSNAQDGDRIINQFERVYKAEVTHDTNLEPEGSEVTTLKWFTASELKTLFSQQSDKFTPGLLYDIQHYFPEFWS
jgi:isopentenyl-diphosphate Delta-isomerase